MRRIMSLPLAVALFTLSILVAIPNVGMSQQTTTQEQDGVFYVGSFLLSILHVPVKLATCLGTQATAAVAYTATYGVAGSYDGDTHGREIGEVARRSCTGAWFITPEQVKKDYGN